MSTRAELRPPLALTAPRDYILRRSKQEEMMASAPADIFHVPQFPRFANAEEERRHRKQRLAAAFRLFAA